MAEVTVLELRLEPVMLIDPVAPIDALLIWLLFTVIRPGEQSEQAKPVTALPMAVADE